MSRCDIISRPGTATFSVFAVISLAAKTLRCEGLNTYPVSWRIRHCTDERLATIPSRSADAVGFYPIDDYEPRNFNRRASFNRMILA